jgi:hypothetical protein
MSMNYTFVFAAALAVFGFAGVNSASAHQVGNDHGWHWGHAKEERAQHRVVFDARHDNVVTGKVTAVDGSVITIDPVGKKTSTTINPSASTSVLLKGEATTTSAIQVGSKVAVVGSTTATSETGDTITASVIRLAHKGWGYFKFKLHLF